MIKYFYLIIALNIVVSAKAFPPLFLYQQKVDSIYETLSLEEKIHTILTTSNNNALPQTNTPVRHIVCGQTNLKDAYQNAHFWLDMDCFLDYVGVDIKIGSEHLVRSALMRGDNKELQHLFTNLLCKNGTDGFYYDIESPFAMLFPELETPLANYFYMPLGRVLTPTQTSGKELNYFAIDIYDFPSKAISSHKMNQLQGEHNDLLLNMESTLSESIKWLDYQKMAEDRQTPSVQSILMQGGLFYCEDKVKVEKDLTRLFSNNILKEELLEKSCKNSLLAFYLQKHKPKFKQHFTKEQVANNIQTKLYRKGLVLLQNEEVIPLNGLDQRSVAVLHLGQPKTSSFQEMLSHYLPTKNLNIVAISEGQINKVKKECETVNTIIVGIEEGWIKRNKLKKLYSRLDELAAIKDVIFVYFGGGEYLSKLEKKNLYKGICLAFDNTKVSQETAAQLIMGGIGAKGVLPYNIGKLFSFGDGVTTAKTRLSYATDYFKSYPDSLANIDKIVYQAIRERATPGCQVLVAKGGDIIYNKSFGYHTYDKKHKVANTDLYDIASITKITASVPSLMAMIEEGKLSINDTLSMHIPRLTGSNKEGMMISDMLVHQAGLVAWIPFYMRTIDKDKLSGKLYSNRYTKTHNIRVDRRLYMNKSVKYRSDVFKNGKSEKYDVNVCENMFMNREYIDSMQMAIDTSAVKSPAKYKYSDLSYYYYKEIIESKYNQPIEDFVQERFYKNLGADRLTYLPLEKFSKKEIVPSENDLQWRKSIVQGYVHDPGAAMLGGVGGHAGLFGNAESLAKVMQLYLQKGNYGGEQIFMPKTVEVFTSTYKEDNRRGLGFDKPETNPNKGNPVCDEATPSSFGHSGFTGTLAWVDPEYDLVYIFLSNRVFPRQYNKQLIKTNVRSRIHTAIYHSLPEFWENNPDED